MKTAKKYSGVVVPMLTPFTEQLTIDTEAVQKIVHHILNGKAFPFILGTTGEASSISRSERKKMVQATVNAVAGKTTLYAGITGNSMRDAVEEGKLYRNLGVDVLVATMPSYYPVDASQMLRYFEGLADQLQQPLIIYNIPATTHLSIPIEVVEQLSAHPYIVGFKDSEKGVERIAAATHLWKDRADFSYLLGWALMSKSALEQGADGIVPSSGNLVPKVYQQIYEAALSGDNERAAKAQSKGDLVSEMYQKNRLLSNSLSAFKAMLAAYNLCGPSVLPPLYRLEEEQQIMQAVTNTFGNLKNINNV